jgi:3-oxoacyl-[acyl-carrier-protein] synthase II
MLLTVASEGVVKRRVVITGMGALSPVGVGLDEMWQGLMAGRSGVRTIELYDASALPVRIAGQVPKCDLGPLPATAVAVPASSRRLSFTVAATRMAMDDAGPALESVQPCRRGVSFAANESHPFPELLGPLYASAVTPGGFDEGLLMRSVVESVPVEEMLYQEAHAALALLSEILDVRGPVVSCLTACASGTQAIGDGFRMIRRGEADVCVAGGADSMLSPLKIPAYNRLGALSKRNDEPARASRPFDLDRDGFVLGEGAGVLVLEELEHALERGARIYAEVAGYAAYQEAHHLTGASPEARGPAAAMRRALEDAGIAPGAIGYVNAHGTSTPDNDVVETRALKAVLGSHAYRTPVSSTKSMMGHLVAAAGAVEAIVTVMALREQMAPPTINLERPDPQCDLDYVPNHARALVAEYAMSNSFGFGGQNAVLVLRRWPVAAGAD